MMYRVEDNRLYLVRERVRGSGEWQSGGVGSGEWG